MKKSRKSAPYTGTVPDENGHFGPYGGSFIPETLVPAAVELAREYLIARQDPSFLSDVETLLSSFVGRPTPLYHAKKLSEHIGALSVYLKREDLCLTGAHKINNTVGQVLLAQRMGKHRVIAETGAGQHGVATATVCALMDMTCIVYMGEEDMKRQSVNVSRMRLLGAEVVPVRTGTRTLKDATSEAIRDWVTNVDTTFYLIGSVVGMHPYPMMVRDFQSVIGRETKSQFLKRRGKLPDTVVACVGGGSNAMGIFYPMLDDRDHIHFVGVEAAGEGLDGRHAAPLARGSKGVLHGAMQYVLQDADGQIREAHSVSAGLDYPGVGPEHAYLKDMGYVEYTSVTDSEAVDAFMMLSRLEGIVPALESAHAIAYVLREGKSGTLGGDVVVNLSGRGDKDLDTVLSMTGRTV